MTGPPFLRSPPRQHNAESEDEQRQEKVQPAELGCLPPQPGCLWRTRLLPPDRHSPRPDDKVMEGTRQENQREDKELQAQQSGKRSGPERSAEKFSPSDPAIEHIEHSREEEQREARPPHPAKANASEVDELGSGLTHFRTPNHWNDDERDEDHAADPD